MTTQYHVYPMTEREREREREREKEENERDRDEWETKCRVSGQERHTCGHVKAAW